MLYWSTINWFWVEIDCTGSIELCLSNWHKIRVILSLTVSSGGIEAKLGLADALGKWLVILNLHLKLTACVLNRWCNSQLKCVYVLNFKCFRKIRLGRNWNNFILVIKVEKLNWLAEASPGSLDAIDELLICTSEPEAFRFPLEAHFNGLFILHKWFWL